MGKGDRRSKKGKIFRGSFGKYRMKLKNLETPVVEAKPKAKKTKAKKTTAKK